MPKKARITLSAEFADELIVNGVALREGGVKSSTLS